MRTTLSISLPKDEATQMRTLAKHRGFPSVSEFVRYLLTESAGEIITDEELLRRSRNADALHKKGKLPKLTSLAEMI
jgi:Arc/MetJ-type ribon-helix-helix transcriptional regulator